MTERPSLPAFATERDWQALRRLMRSAALTYDERASLRRVLAVAGQLTPRTVPPPEGE